MSLSARCRPSRGLRWFSAPTPLLAARPSRLALAGIVALAGIGIACTPPSQQTEHHDAAAGITATVTSTSAAPPPPLAPPAPASPCPEAMVLIPAGEFWMGSDSTGGDALHRVKLSAYCVDTTEVTVAAYRRCTQDPHAGVKCAASPRPATPADAEPDKKLWRQFCNGDRSDRDEHPINCVDWAQADAYCTWAGKKLPTEAQWEYAARGNTGRTYPWGEDKPGPKLLNSCGTECRALGRRLGQKWWIVLYEEHDGAEATSPVGKYPAGASPFGVQDMEGNVSEWVADWYDDYGRSPSPLIDPRGPERPGAEKTRIIRGNDWQGGLPADVSAARTRYQAARRYRSLPSESGSVLGFRCASEPASAPTPSPDLPDPTKATGVPWRRPPQLGVGPGGTCAIANGGHVYCWGIELGPKSGHLPVQLPPLQQFEQVSRYNVHACARTAAGEVWCAGRNSDGQLGAETKEKCVSSVSRDGTAEYVPCSGSLLRVDGLPPIADVVAGYDRSCAIGRDEQVYCWGMGLWGVLGVVPAEPCDCARSPVKLPGLDSVRALALGSFFSCALKADGTVWCWGSNKEGARGQGNYDERPRWDKHDKDAVEPPVKVRNLTGIVEIAAGSMHVCALEASRRKLWCWGLNNEGQLGIDTHEKGGASDDGNPRAATPMEVLLPEELGEIAAIAAGGSATCALGASGSLFCWGAFEERQSHGGPRLPIRRVQEAPPLAAIALDGDRLCGVSRTGKIVCWGRATASDQLGFPSKPGRCYQGCWEPPTALSGLVVDTH